MKIAISILKYLLLFSVVFIAGCRTEFEKIRVSNDAQRILEAAHKYYELKEYTRAQALYELAIPTYRGKIEAEDIFFNYAYAHYYNRQYILAAHYFTNFANTFVNSPRREEASYMSAYSNYMLSPSHKLDQTYSLKAVDGLQLFINTYPNSERISTANNLIDEIRLKLEAKAYEEGKLYYDLGHFNSAMQSFENMLKEFPETHRGETVRYLIAKSSYVLAERSVYIRKEERFSGAIEKCNAFLRKYPESKYSKEVNNFIIDSRLEIDKINS